VAPFSYWRRGRDAYTHTLNLVDKQIGRVIDALPKDVAENTLIVFVADHGDYAGAHGLLAGKIGTLYKEAFHVPLIVVDPSGRFTGETEHLRDGLVSSVDLLRMLVSFGHNGSQHWLKGDLADLYGDRLNILPMLRSAKAPGRSYVVLASDEVIPNFANPDNAPLHIAGVQTQLGKLGAYAHWAPGTDTVVRSSLEAELYSYATPEGKSELDNTASSSPLTLPGLAVLLDCIMPEELRAQMPEPYQQASDQAKRKYLLSAHVVGASKPPGDPDPEDMPTHAFGRGF